LKQQALATARPRGRSIAYAVFCPRRHFPFAFITGGPRWRLELEPELDQATDGFGTTGRVVLASGPRIEGGHKLVGKTDCSSWIRARRLTA
jgi:hypothetical protein